MSKYNPYVQEYRFQSSIQNKDNVVSIVYNRYINNIVCEENNINIGYDLKNNNIVSYNYSYNDYEIKEHNSNIIIDDLYRKLVFKNIFKLNYVIAKDRDENKDLNNVDIKSFLVWNFDDQSEIRYISGIDGEFKNYYGEDIKDIEKKDFNIIYGDVNDSVLKEKLQKLYNIDIYINKENVNLDDFISEYEFETLLNECFVYPYDIVEEKENFILRDYAAVKVVDKFTNYGDLSKLSGIFKTVYMDETDIDEIKLGAVAIANKLGYFEDDYNFFPKNNLTYKEALNLVYNIIK